MKKAPILSGVGSGWATHRNRNGKIGLQDGHLLSDAGITGPLADTLTGLASTAAGAAVGADTCRDQPGNSLRN